MTINITDLVRGVKERREAALPAVALLILGFGLYVFLDLAHELAEGELREIDKQLFLVFRHAADHSVLVGPSWLGEAALEITALGGYPVIALVVSAVLGLLLVLRLYGPALYTLLSVGTGALVCTALKHYYGRARPAFVDQLDTVHTASFPSGHALVSTLCYLTLAALVMRFFDDWRVRIYVAGVALFVALLVGVSRVYLGVHWPSDVAAGWALGAAWASLCWLLVSGLQFYRRKNRGRTHGE